MWKSFSHRLMHELTVGVIGLGNIGSHIAQACKALGMTVWGLGRKELDKPPPCVDHYRSTGGLTELLQSCDYVCNVLPSTPSSRHLLSGTVLENCKERKAVFINVGRGDVIDEGSLVQALEKGWLSGAIVDVFEKEPLPKDSPLWDMPGVVITPHNSGIAPADVVRNITYFCVKLKYKSSNISFGLLEGGIHIKLHMRCCMDCCHNSLQHFA